MKKIFFLATILATSLSFGQNTFPPDGNVGIGTSAPSASLDIITSAVVGSETLLKLKVSDASEDYLKISNSTMANAQFIPSLYGYHITDNRAALYLVGDIGLNNDIGSEPIMVFDSRLNSSPITNRPLFAWDSYGSRKMTLSANGKLGIGTTNPRANLDMAKDISNGQLGTVFGRLPEGDGSGLGTYLGVKGYATQGADPYDVRSFSIVHDFYGQTNNSINFYRGGGMLGGFMTFNTSDNTEKMRIGTNGYVGIGTTNPDSKLTVKGKIHAEEVKIDLAVPADYVFEKYYLGESSLRPDYTLLTLSEVEKFAKENHHLPNVPSAKEIKEDGLLLGEMSNILLQKVEELTLYSIDQQKKIEKLEKENDSFKKLEERLIRLEKEL